MTTSPEHTSSGRAVSPDAPEYPRAAAPPPQQEHSRKATSPPPYPSAHQTAQPPSSTRPSPRPRDGFEPGPHPRSEAGGHHPHEMSFVRSGRVHLLQKQRGADAMAVGQLLLYLPSFILSLLMVVTISFTLLSNAAWAFVLVWLASGALAFHRPTEAVLARHVLNLRYPTPRERTRLEPIWQEVTARAGIEGHTYELWIEESNDLNALAAAGHVVGVTRFSLENLPGGQLAAVLAHELAHHVGGHAWSSLLGEWYSMPGRLAWTAVRRLARVGIVVGRRLNPLLMLVLVVTACSFVLAFAQSYWFIVLLVIAVPYPLAAIARRSELRADQHAAALGFAPMLAEVLQTMHTLEFDNPMTTSFAARSDAGAFGRIIRTHSTRSGRLGKLLASHPDYYTRLHHLAPYLGSPR